MNLPAAPLQYLRDVWQGILNELQREDLRNVKRDVAETFNGSLAVSGTLMPQGLLDLSGSSAGQIKFPASQNASADPNTLDDYEESATLSNTLTIGDVTNSFSNIASTLAYDKVGRRVIGEGRVAWTGGIGSAGASQLTIGGLPFTSRNVSGFSYPIGFGYVSGLDLTTTLNQITAYVQANATTIVFYRNNDNANPTAMPANGSSSSGEINFSFSYPT